MKTFKEYRQWEVVVDKAPTTAKAKRWAKRRAQKKAINDWSEKFYWEDKFNDDGEWIAFEPFARNFSNKKLASMNDIHVAAEQTVLAHGEDMGFKLRFRGEMKQELLSKAVSQFIWYLNNLGLIGDENPPGVSKYRSPANMLSTVNGRELV